MHGWDLAKKLAVGSASLEFMGETVVRALLLYTLLNIAMRLMGRRIVAQMTFADMATIATLGAAIGAPMHAGDVGLLSSALVLAVAVAVYRVVGAAIRRSRALKIIVSKGPAILIRDGRLDLKSMHEANVSRDQLFAVLRSLQLEQLGQVERAYLEETGAFAVYEADSALPGLSILPDKDLQMRGRQTPQPTRQTCTCCGNTIPLRTGACDSCGSERWTVAVVARNEQVSSTPTPRRRPTSTAAASTSAAGSHVAAIK